MHKKKATSIQLNLDSELISLLKEDHRRLIELYESVLEARYKEDVDETFRIFEDFQDALKGHLLQEDLHIYSYLAMQFKNYPGLGEIFTYLYRRMLDMEQKVEVMCKEHSRTSTKEWSWEMMPDTLERLGDILKERMQQEEALLYPLYSALSSLGPLPQLNIDDLRKTQNQP